MESNILQQLAAFDVKAKIDISICFEDSNEAQDVTVKTENVIDDVKSNSHDTNASLHNFLEHIKKEIKEELPETTEENLNENELNSDEQHISKEILALQTKNLQTRTTNSNDERKRKQKRLQIYANKRRKKESTEENVANHLENHNKENNTHKSLVSNYNFPHQDVATSQVNPTNVESGDVSPSSSESEEINTTSKLISCLSALSENMRLVMEAYAHHKQYNTAYEHYEKQKMQYFNESYAIVLKLIIPEIQNKKFLSTFLHQTYQHALKRPGLSKCDVRDYVMLLKQLIHWTKKKHENQTASNQENTVQPAFTGSNYFQGPVSENTPNKPESESESEEHCLNNKQNKTQSGEKGDMHCIFSTGSPGNEISIHIDLNLNQQLSTTENLKNNGASVVHTPQLSADLTRPPTPSQKQPTPDNKNKYLLELLQLSPQIEPMAPCAKRKQLYNDIFTDEIITRQSQVKKPLETQNGYTMIGQSPHLLPQSTPTPLMLTQNDLAANTAQTAHNQSIRAPSLHNQPIHTTSSTNAQKPPETQNGYTMIGQSQHLNPQSMSTPVMLTQNELPANTAHTAHSQSIRAPSLYNQPIRTTSSTNLQKPPETQNIYTMIGQSQHLHPQPMSTPVMLTQNELPANTAHTAHSQSIRAPSLYNQPIRTTSMTKVQKPPETQNIYTMIGQSQYLHPQPMSTPVMLTQNELLANITHTAHSQSIRAPSLYNQPIRATSSTKVQKPQEMQNRYTMIGQPRHLYPQSMPTPATLTHKQLPVNTAHSDHSQSTHAPSLHRQPIRKNSSKKIQKSLETQNGYTVIGQSRYLPPQSMPSHNQQPANTAHTAHRQSTHSPSSYHQPIRQPPPYHQPIRQTPPNVPPWFQAWHQQVQSPLSNYQPPSMDIQQSGQPQLQHQHLTNTLLHYEQMVRPPQNGQVPTTQSQAILPQYIQQNVSPHTGQLPAVLSECERRLQNVEWLQGLNELYQGHQEHQKGPPQQQIYKNAPRSSSTDSGFNSPLNFNTASDQTVPPVPQQTETTQILITHVTSLNPNIPYMPEGNCVVCKKITKKVCMGCMKIYYCTYECQVQDWLKHEPDCHKYQASV